MWAGGGCDKDEQYETQTMTLESTLEEKGTERKGRN